MRLPGVTPWVLLGLLALGVRTVAEESEWVRPYDAHLPGTELAGEPCRAVRVVGRTPQGLVPVAGAVVSTWTEDVAPTALRSRKLGEARTDEHGIANVTWSGGKPHHWIVEAPGWATSRDVWRGEGFSLGEMELEPGVTKRFRILGPLGEPLAGARVEVFLGCAHAPTLWKGATDEDGILSFADLPLHPDGFQIRVAAPGVRPIGQYWFPPARVGDGEHPPTLVARPGLAVSGVVVDPEGRPRKGVVVREIWHWRGPVDVTDTDGRFRLDGLQGDLPLGLYHPDGRFGDRPSAVVDAFVPDVPLRVTLRDDRPWDPGEGERRFGVDVDVRVRYTEEDGPCRGAPVTFVRLSDGFVVRGRTGGIGAGLFAAAVPPGEYRILAGGGFSGVEEGTATVRVPRSDAKPVEIVLELQPFVVGGDGVFGATFLRLQMPGNDKMPVPSYLPARVPAVVVVDDYQVFPFEPPRDGFRRVDIPERKPVLLPLHLELEDDEVSIEDAEATLGSQESEALDENGDWLGVTWAAGPMMLWLDAPGHQFERRELVIPTSPGRLDLGTIRLRRSEERVFRIVDSAGEPVPDAALRPELRGPTWRSASENDDGSFTVAVGPRPETWYASAEGWRLLRVRLTLESPTEIPFPGCRITIRVRDGEGRPVPAVGYVDESSFRAADGAHDLRGVPAGPHVILVGARGHAAQVHRMVLGDGEHRTIDVTLAPRR
jgi:hypothetical protein